MAYCTLLEIFLYLGERTPLYEYKSVVFEFLNGGGNAPIPQLTLIINVAFCMVVEGK
jgi:hypothetical protein